jgi:tetratricopeptide (TPR) repeat protein
MPDQDEQNGVGLVRGSVLLNEAAELHAQGKKEAASMKVVEHLRRHRDDPRGLAMLGKFALDEGAISHAEHFLRRALTLGDNRHDTKRDFASSLLHQEVLDEALHAFSTLESVDDEPQLTATRASILDRLGRHQEALVAHRSAVERSNGNSRYRISYGHSLRFAGQTEDAIAVYRAIVEEDPERGEAWWSLADIKTYRFSDDEVGRMKDALGYAVDPLNIVPMRKALGRALHDRKRYDEAFAEYAEANRLRDEATKYDPTELTRDVDEFIELTADVPVPAPTSLGDSPLPVPIFLVSPPRSGSTLLEQILDQHPDIEARGELPYVRALLRQAFERHMRSGFVSVSALLKSMSAEVRKGLGGEYLRRAALHQKTNKKYFIDKMPSNWTDILFIRSILPQARFVAIRRNALDCCLSNHFHHFGKAHAASYNLVTQGRAYADFARLMDHLVVTSPDALVYVRYEELIDEPEKVLRRVLDYLELGWDDNLLEFHRAKRNIRTPSAEQVRQPLNRKGFGTWRHYDQWLGPLRDALGEYADD